MITKKPTSITQTLLTAAKLAQPTSPTTERDEMRVTPEDMATIGQLMMEIEMLKNKVSEDNKEIIAGLEAQIVQVFSKRFNNPVESDIIRRLSLLPQKVPAPPTSAAPLLAQPLMASGDASTTLQPAKLEKKSEMRVPSVQEAPPTLEDVLRENQILKMSLQRLQIENQNLENLLLGKEVSRKRKVRESQDSGDVEDSEAGPSKIEKSGKKSDDSWVKSGDSEENSEDDWSDFGIAEKRDCT